MGDVNYQAIPPLLHDARLSDCCFDPNLKTIRLEFQCLRRNLDRTAIDDPVELKLDGVERITSFYSPSAPTVRPSEFGLGKYRITTGELRRWRRQPSEVHLAFNSHNAEYELETSYIRESLVGDGKRESESPLRVHLSFQPHNYGAEGVAINLLVECDSVEVSAGGLPLDIATWEEQFGAWWEGWRDYWDAQYASRWHDVEPTREATFIPAGSGDPPDLSYLPPAAPPYQVLSTDAPPELLKPIEDYHIGFHERDWRRVAAAHPVFDYTVEERAEQLKKEFLGFNHGRWQYIRCIDSWWREGIRACVVVRGVEHTMGDNEVPTSNEETVITYGLRKFRGAWGIATWSQGRPKFGSAPKLTEAQTWRAEWNLEE